MTMRLLLILILGQIFVGALTETGTLDSNTTFHAIASKYSYEEIYKVKIPKCCKPGEHIFGYIKKCRRPNPKMVSIWNMGLDFSEVPIYYKNLTKTGKVLKNDSSLLIVPGQMYDPEFNKSAFNYYLSENHNYYLDQDGILHQEVPNHYDRWYNLNASRYCVDYQLPLRAINMTVPELRFWSIVAHGKPHAVDHIITAGLLVSCFFLLLVLIVYGLLKELRNLSGMVLMAYVASLLGAFFVMGLIQMVQHTHNTCTKLTYSSYFLFLASFCWMTVMSCDIWWTFRGYAKARPIHRRGELFKFCMYGIYAWGLPAAMTIMLVVLNETRMTHISWFVTPNVPERGCFLAAEEKFLYLYIPMLILICCNWVFYLMTAFNIWRLHRATAILDSAAAGTPAAHRSQKYRFLVYLKLSLIMGINWVLEVVSTYQPEFQGWYITDIYNMLIGLSIFLIFCCKKKIFKKLQKKIFGTNEWHFPRQYSTAYTKSRSSNTTDSDVSQDAPVCGNPKGITMYNNVIDKDKNVFYNCFFLKYKLK